MNAASSTDNVSAFVSTRGLAPAVSIDSALVAGLAPDGGLYVPAVLPTPCWNVDAMAGATLTEVGEQVLAGSLQAMGEERVELLGRSWSLGGVSGVLLYMLGLAGEIFMLTSVYLVMLELDIAGRLTRHSSGRVSLIMAG